MAGHRVVLWWVIMGPANAETITLARPPETRDSEVGTGVSRALRRPEVFSPIRDTSLIDGEQLLQFP